MQDVVSVIIPIYNTELYLERCLESLLGQSYHDLEIILVDDGSTDKSGIICDRYAEKDKRVKVYHKINTGQADSRNYALERINGNYIVFVDSDDYVSHDYIQYLMDLMREFDADISCCEMKRIWKYGEAAERIPKKEMRKIYNTRDALENLFYMKELNCAPCGKLFKKSVWDGLQFPVGYIYEDLATIYKVFRQAQKISYSSVEKYFYYQRQGSTMRCEFNEKKLSRIKFSDEIEKFSQEYDPTLFNAACSRKFWSNAGALMDIPWDKKYKSTLDTIQKNINATRKIVLYDKEAKKNIRVMAACSYFGIRNLKRLGNIYKKMFK